MPMKGISIQMKTQFTGRFFGVLGIAAFSCVAMQASTVFNFDSDAIGTNTQFSDTVNGLTATFLSSADPGGFAIEPTIFDTLTGNVLGSPGSSGAQDIALEIDFNQNLSDLSMLFATSDFGPASPFTLTAYLGSTQVGSISATGAVPNGFIFPEGTIEFTGTAFNSVVLSSPALDFAIDDVAATTAPEPGTWVLLGLGLGALCLSRGRLRDVYSKGALALGTIATCTIPTLAAGPVFPLPASTVSTIPANGDVNPYGVVYVPTTVPTDGLLQQGDVLVSNFNDSENLQGTGTTIVRISESGNQTLFYQSSVHGLTAALGILSNGVVIVGNLPTADGTPATVQAGAITFIDRHGTTLGTISGSSYAINGPWGIAVHDLGNGTAHLFVSNVLSGNIERYTVTYAGSTVTGVTGVVTIGSGFSHRLDPAALVLGPSGLAFDATHDILYIASSSDDAVYALNGAEVATSSLGTGTQLFQDLTHLHGPLDMVLTPTGHLLVANSDGSNVDPNQPSELEEFTSTGTFVSQFSVDPNNGGAFGLNLFNVGWGTVRIAAVDDNANTLRLWTTVLQ